VEGLPLEPERHYLLADSPDAFAYQICRLLTDAVLRSRISTAARELVENHFSHLNAARQFERICAQTAGEHN